MKFFYNLFCISILFLITHFENLSATHMSGAEVSYEYVGSNKYKLIAKIYRGCDAIALNTPTGTVYISNDSGRVCGSVSFSWTRTAIKEISLLCKSATHCNPANSWVGGYGFEEHIFQATVDLSVSPISGYLSGSNCKTVTFAISQCCRDKSVTTAASDVLMATATVYLKNLATLSANTNSSPKFISRPIINYCCNNPVSEDFQAIDTNNDILRYSLVPSITTFNQNLTYISPWSGSYPLTPYCKGGGVNCTPKPYAALPEGIFLDSLTGEFIYTPVTCGESGPVCVLVREYRKSGNKLVLVGSARRDVVIRSLDCGKNRVPVITANASYTLCTEDSSCIEILSQDTFKNNQGNLDTLQLNYETDINSKYISVINTNGREPKIKICWKPTTAEYKNEPYYLKVKFTDQNCPYALIAYKFIKFYIRKSSQVTTKLTLSVCNDLVSNFQSTEKFTQSTNKWVITDSASKDTILNSANLTIQLSSLKPGTYYTQFTFESKEICCKYFKYDTIRVTKPIASVNIGADTAVCKNYLLSVQAQIKNATAPYKFKWKLNKSVLKDSNSVFNHRIGSKTDTLDLTVTDSNKCLFSDRIIIKHKNLPDIQWLSDTLGPICRETEDIALNPHYNTTLNPSIYSLNSIGCYENSKLWYLKNAEIPSCNQNLDPNTIQLVISAKDSSGCYNYDTALMIVNCKPLLQLDTANICQSNTNYYPLKTLMNIYFQSKDSKYSWIVLNAPKGLNKSSLVFDNSGLDTNWKLSTGMKGDTAYVGRYTLVGCKTSLSNGCKTCDTTYINVSSLPDYSFTHTSVFCTERDSIDLWKFIKANGSKFSYHGENLHLISCDGDTAVQNWRGSKINRNRWFNPVKKEGKWLIRFTARSGSCYFSDTFSIKLNPKPVASFSTTPADTAFTSNPKFTTSNSSSIADNSQLNYLWKPGTGKVSDESTLKNTDFLYPSAEGEYDITLIVSSLAGCADSVKKHVYIHKQTSGIFQPEIGDFKINNACQIIGIDYSEIETRIYDLSGKLVLVSFNNSPALLPAGIYEYRIYFIDLKNKAHVVNGKINLP